MGIRPKPVLIAVKSQVGQSGGVIFLAMVPIGHRRRGAQRRDRGGRSPGAAGAVVHKACRPVNAGGGKLPAHRRRELRP